MPQGMNAGFANVRQEMNAAFAEVREEMNAGFAQLREEMKAGFAEVRQAMAHLETRLERRIGDLIKWSFVFWVGAVGAIAMLASVLP